MYVYIVPSGSVRKVALLLCRVKIWAWLLSYGTPSDGVELVEMVRGGWVRVDLTPSESSSCVCVIVWVYVCVDECVCERVSVCVSDCVSVCLCVCEWECVSVTYILGLHKILDVHSCVFHSARRVTTQHGHKLGQISPSGTESCHRLKEWESKKYG